MEQESDILRRKKRALLQPESVEDDLRCFTNAFDPPKPNDERLASKAFVKMEREHRNTFQSSGAPSPYAAGRGGGHADIRKREMSGSMAERGHSVSSQVSYIKL